jgi:predicted metal-dependent peptidase
MTSDDILNRIAQARLWALSSTNRDVVFYGAAACALTDRLDDKVKTASTDGRRINWGPDFVRSLYSDGPVRGNARVRFVLLHEVLHCAHGHLWRLPLTPEGNIAGDYAINRTLRGIPGIEAPAGILDDRKFDALAEEEILKALRQQQQPQPKPQPQQQDGNGAPQDGDSGEGQGDDTPGEKKPGKSQGNDAGEPADAGGCGGFEAPAPDAQPEPGSGKPTETLRQEWDRTVVQAAQTAQALAQGNMPASAKRLLDRIAAKVRPDWRAETADFVRSTISSVPDWSRQARRTATAPVIYPRRRRDDLGAVVFVRDTSGSIGTATVAEFNAHIANVIAETGCDAIVLDADAAVQAEYRLAPGEDVPVRAEGGGGTDFRPAFARVEELRAEGERIAGVVYLTDLCGTHPATAPDLPILWACTSDLTAPSGRTVRVEV